MFCVAFWGVTVGMKGSVAGSFEYGVTYCELLTGIVNQRHRQQDTAPQQEKRG
jgi:hypothetical protein